MSIRLRLAAAFAFIAAALFALGAWIFVATLTRSMLSNLDAQLATQASQASQYVTPSTGGAATSSGANRPPPYVVQIIDGTGRVQSSSSDAEHGLILNATQLAQARRGRITVTVDQEGEPLRILAEPFASHPGWVVVAGTSLETENATIHRVQVDLVIGGIAFVVAAGLGSFFLATAALRPVERLRRQVSELARRDATGTVAVPPTHDEIAALAETMNQLLVTTQSALARERNLIADTSHELRTPFTLLQGELELAARPGRSREELQEALARISEEVGRLSRLTDDLLLLSRSDQGHLIAEPHPSDVAEILQESANRRADRARSIDVTCRVDAPSDLVWDLDSRRVRQAIDNLLDNALRFAPPSTEIVLQARTEGDDLLLSVADAGPGFPVGYLPHAFERFRRPDVSRSRGEGGAGLGMAIVQAVALAHGGIATADNRPDGGAIVTLRLPRPGGERAASYTPGMGQRRLTPPSTGSV